MKVKNIHWIGFDEAEVKISDDNDRQTLIVFCHPCSLKQGDRVYEPLEAFETGKISISKSNQFLVRQQILYSYYFVARVIEFVESLVEVNGILIRVSHLPGDCKIGDFVEVSVSQLDLI